MDTPLSSIKTPDQVYGKGNTLLPLPDPRYNGVRFSSQSFRVPNGTRGVFLGRARGHPLKGPCQEEKLLLSKKKGFLVSLAVALPTSPPLPKLLSIFGVSLYCSSHPSGLRSYGLFGPMEIKSKLPSCETPKISPRNHPILSRPSPLKADQKIFGSRPCPNVFDRSRGYESRLWRDSRHGQ